MGPPLFVLSSISDFREQRQESRKRQSLPLSAPLTPPLLRRCSLLIQQPVLSSPEKGNRYETLLVRKRKTNSAKIKPLNVNS